MATISNMNATINMIKVRHKMRMERLILDGSTTCFDAILAMYYTKFTALLFFNASNFKKSKIGLLYFAITSIAKTTIKPQIYTSFSASSGVKKY
jgi:hypothetical protein